MNVELTPIRWLGDSIDVVRSWPAATERRAGEELFRLQLGSDPIHWRTMKSVTRRKDSIVVLHAFEKKTQRTSKGDIATGKQRLKEIE